MSNDSFVAAETFGRTILLVEDDMEMLRLLDEELQETGFRVVQTMNGRDALVQVDRIKPDIVISDFRIPGGGLAFLRELREKCSRCRIIVTTSLSDDATRAKVLQQGVDEFLGKPVRISDLLDTINRLLR